MAGPETFVFTPITGTEVKVVDPPTIVALLWKSIRTVSTAVFRGVLGDGSAGSGVTAAVNSVGVVVLFTQETVAT